MILVKSFKKS